jgi:hypothetical protein
MKRHWLTDSEAVRAIKAKLGIPLHPAPVRTFATVRGDDWRGSFAKVREGESKPVRQD